MGLITKEQEKAVKRLNSALKNLNKMKIVFVINNVGARYVEYKDTGVLNAPNRRAVEIELTPEQVEKIGIRKIGFDCGEDVMETIESVSLKSL